MIPIQINGKTILLSFQEWISMTPEDYQDLVASDKGYEIDDPFDKSFSKMMDRMDIEDDRVEDFPDLNGVPDLTEEEIKRLRSEEG